MTEISTSTRNAISPDSGEPWATEGAWKVADGIHRVPLPLPSDALQAVNVYVLESEIGLTLIDGGWAIEDARDVLERQLRSIGYAFSDIRRFLVTHSHRDHFTLATVLGHEYGAEVVLGAGDRPAIELIADGRSVGEVYDQSLRQAGAAELVLKRASRRGETPEPKDWTPPDRWLEGTVQFDAGGRVLEAVETPGHTPGHYVFADLADRLLFAGDHVLPTITPSIGFTMPRAEDPLSDFIASLRKVRDLPDLALLPAHGPLAPSSHARVGELLAHHDRRLALSLMVLRSGATTALEVARQLPWTRHEKSYADLGQSDRAMAVFETHAHLCTLRRDGLAGRESRDGVDHFYATG